MKKIVAKFGGSNLKKKEDILKLVRVIKAYNKPLIIVVSAFYGITNHLTNALDSVKQDEAQVKNLVNFLLGLKEEVINENFEDKEWAKKTLEAVEKRICELERFLTGIHYIGDVPEFVEDVVLSYGERLSSLILNAILQSHGINSEEALPEEMPLITDGEFGNATVHYQKSEEGVKNRLKEDKIYVVPGFYGVSEKGKITLLGRGGSDYSAAAIARCLNAESLDVWKDVDGFMSADPKLVKNPVRITDLSYTEAAELSYFGAGILHPRTVEPLRKVNIPIRILNVDTFSTAIIPGTIVHSQETITLNIIKSVTYSDDFCILSLKGAGVGMKKGVLAKTTSALDMAGINIKSVITSQIAINLLLSAADIKRAYQLIEKLQLPTVTELQAIENLTTVAVVGEGILETSGIAGRMFMAIAKKNINARMIASGASPVATYFVVSSADKDASIEAIHSEFFG
ncbi:MAG: aspartate kinase [Salinivirgaceae bacterium]|jgi:aspartokinase/homoserine dehydrogenase 1|nr:aspartate kinase [Salinivirgaceae bacterium]